MDTIQELQLLRAELIQQIDTKIGQILQKLKDEQENETECVNEKEISRVYESLYPLNAGTGIFKGKKPIAVIFADGARVSTPTWKKLSEEVLCHCNADPSKHKALMDLRGKLLGRDRVFLGSEAGKMRSPVKITDALYLETHYDTETLLRILTTRILTAVQYDYSGITIAVRND